MLYALYSCRILTLVIVPDSLYSDDPGPIVPMVNSSESKRSRVILFTDRQTYTSEYSDVDEDNYCSELFEYNIICKRFRHLKI